MAVLQMQRICICGLKKERKQILELLQRRGVIEISDVIPEDSVFQKADVSTAKTVLEKNINAAKDALQVLDNYAPEKKPALSMLIGRSEVSSELYDAFGGKHDSILHTVNRINTLSKKIAENKAELLKLQTQVEMILPWVGLDIPMNFSGTKSTNGFIGTLPDTWTLEMIYEKLADVTPLNVEIISSSREQTCIFVLCRKEKTDSVSEVLRTIGFSYPNSITDTAATDQIKEIEDQMAQARMAIVISEEEIESYKGQREDIQFLLDYETLRAEKYEVISHLVQSKKVFILTGFIPEIEAKDISEELSKKFEVAVELEQPDENEDVPILLQNNGFASPLESTVEAFSPPGKGEIDPTMIMSLFYYALFGLMLSDAGYGAIIALGCAFGLIKFKKTMEDSMKKTLRMYLFCGISTVFWGVMFGSYFGDIVDVITETFIGQKITVPPLWFFPVNEPMRMLTFSLIIGMIHIFAGLAMKFYLCLRNKDYKALLYDVIFWMVLLISSVVILVSMQMVKDIFGIQLSVPVTIVKISTVLALLSAVGIIATNGRESKNPFKRFLKGAYALYGISGYLSDVLSYCRLLALGLATGVIGNVINKMAGMVAGSFIGIIFFVVIMVGGHTLNLGINALGAYVHTNRLQYVEFFGKFYEGGGRKFNPFNMKTKYYKFKEKMNYGRDI